MQLSKGRLMSFVKIRDTPISPDTPATHHVYATHRWSIRDTLVCRNPPVEKLCYKGSTKNTTTVQIKRYPFRLGLNTNHRSFPLSRDFALSLLSLSVGCLVIIQLSERRFILLPGFLTCTARDSRQDNIGRSIIGLR